MFNVKCSNGIFDVNSIIKGFRPALTAVQGLSTRRWNGAEKQWETTLSIETVIELLTPITQDAIKINKFPPNKYQKPIIDYIVNCNPGDQVLVNASAGTGKTATLCMIPDFTNETVGGVAFNRPIADELTARGVDGFTFNSFGLRAMKGKKIVSDKYAKVVMSKINIKTEKHLISPVVKLFDLSRNMQSKKYADLAMKFQVEFDTIDEQRIYELINALYAHKDDVMIDFTDMLYFTVKDNLLLPYFDILGIDECQDINPLRLALIDTYIKQHPQSKIIYVGDPKQAINGWSGTIDNAMGILEKRGKTFPLSLTYRNAKNIMLHVKEAHPNVDTETASKEEGSVTYINQLQFTPVKDDMVICKFNAPLISVAMGLIKRGIPATVRGRDISKKLSYLINKTGCKSVKCLPDGLSKYLGSITVKPEIMETYIDNAETILALSEGCDTLDDIYTKMNELFSDRNSPVILSSIHRAKGLEADTVYILELSSRMVLKEGICGGEDQALNVAYVARTRAINHLVYVK